MENTSVSAYKKLAKLARELKVLFRLYLGICSCNEMIYDLELFALFKEIRQLRI